MRMKSTATLFTALTLCNSFWLIDAWTFDKRGGRRNWQPSTRLRTDPSYHIISGDTRLFTSALTDPGTILQKDAAKDTALSVAAAATKEFLDESTTKLDHLKSASDDKSTTPSSLARALELVDITWNEFLFPVGRGLWDASRSGDNTTTIPSDWDEFWELPVSSTTTTTTNPTTVARQFTTYLERLGVTFVKFGQALSARPDIVPRSLAISLTKLQDRMDVSLREGLGNVDVTREFLRQEFQRIQNSDVSSSDNTHESGALMLSGLNFDSDAEIESFLTTLTDEPVAAASIGVVYSATLPTSNEKVCIKIQRPGILQVVKQDAELLRVAASILESIPSLPFINKLLPQDPKRPGRLIQTDVSGAVEEFMSRIFEELDYRNESDNIELFWSLYSHLRHGYRVSNDSERMDIQVVVPRVYKDLCTEKVLVMEWIEGAKLVDLQRQRQEYASVPQRNDTTSVEQEYKEFSEMLDLIKQGIDCTLSQLLDTGILHADPHGGNLLKVNDNLQDESRSRMSSKTDTKNYRLGYVDFGLLSTVPPTVQEGLICAVSQLVFARNVSAVADLFGELQLVPTDILDDPEERQALAIELEGALSQVLVYSGTDENDTTAIPTLRFDKLLDVLSRLVPRFQFQLPPYFLNNARALSTLEGMAREMDPKFNVLQSVYPYAIQRLLANPTDSPVVDNTLNSLAESPHTGRLDAQKLKKLVDDASLYSGYSRRKVVRDILKTKNGKRLLLRLAREQTLGRGKRAFLQNRLMDRTASLLRL